ncbi:MAG: hypothetical protein NTX45_24010 [Proteobacteria bacterium]|nr:hypothetical protein [Pseudomonadota bacterium]
MEPERISIEEAVSLIYERVKSLKESGVQESRFIDTKIRKPIKYALLTKKILVAPDGDLLFHSLVAWLKNERYSKKHYPGRFDDMQALGPSLGSAPWTITLGGFGISFDISPALPGILPDTLEEYQAYALDWMEKLARAKEEIRERDSLIAELEAELEPLRTERERREAIAEMRRKNLQKNKPQ